MCCYVTTTVPQMLAHCFTIRPIISLGRCFAQMNIAIFLVEAECFLLAIMVYDHFVAIRSPLRYNLIMRKTMCIQFAVGMWSITFILTLIPFFFLQPCLCGNNVLSHYQCEVQAVLSLAWSDIHATGLLILISSFFSLVLPFAFILMTYGCIGLAVLCIHSKKGQGKALSTCGSHLAVVGIFYGSATTIYLQRQTKTFSNQEKVVAVFCGVVTPMLNPVIYSLRNRDVKRALWRMTGKKAEE